jgi:uncharacterized protein (TIGR01777 family)
MQNKKIIIAGGTGFIGQAITKYFGTENEVIILTRVKKNEKSNAHGNVLDNAKEKLNVKYVAWDGIQQGGWSKEINGTDLVINLTGKTVNCRYTEKNRKEIFDSRTNPTKAIGIAIKNATTPPKLWINAASTTIYRHAMDRPQDEITGEMENDFSVQVCKRWEEVFYQQPTPFTRKVALRMAITLGEEGVMTPYFNLLKFGLGGKQGSGKQMYSWVHITDTCRMIEWFFDNSELEGTYNCCSLNPVTNAAFMQTLRKVTGHSFGLPAYTWMLKIGAFIIGTETELVLKSRWVIPTKALQAGFTFQYSYLEAALKDIINKTPRKKYHLF